MNSKLPCHIVRDLLPNYADGLLSPESEAEVKAHLEECEACRTVYRQMTEPEPEPQISEDAAEVDYLKKYKRRRKSILIAAVAFALLIAGAAAINAKIQAAKADISYDEASKTMVVYGKDDTNIRLPETIHEATELDVQFDTFHVRVNLPMLRTDGLDLAEYLPAYLGGTNESLKFIRNYLNENCPDIDITDRASKYVDLTILPNGNYAWSEDEERIALDIGDFYWHREELYILALLGERSVEWKQLGYAWYLGSCLDPYFEQQTPTFTDAIEHYPYYDAFVKGGGTKEEKPENYRILMDAVSYVCLTDGMHWGTPYESWALSSTGSYSGPKKTLDPGNDMSVLMAASFIGYLSDQYGFDTVSGFCFGDAEFEEAFGTDWQTAYGNWAAWIVEKYGE